MKRNSQNWVQALASIQSPPSLPSPPQKKKNNNNNFWQQRSKLPQKQIFKFSGLVQFCFIFLLFANHIIALNSSQFPSNPNVLIFLITSKPLSNIYRKYNQIFIGNINKATCRNVSNRRVFSRHYFVCLLQVKNGYQKLSIAAGGAFNFQLQKLSTAAGRAS